MTKKLVLKICKSQKWVPKNYFAASERLNVSILGCLRKTNIFFINLDHFLQKKKESNRNASNSPILPALS